MLLAPFQNLLNRNIAASSAARAMCRRLDGKLLALKFDGIPLNVFLRAEGEQVILSSQSEATPTATLSGTPLAFMRMIGPQPENALRGGSVHIAGDAEAAQAFSELLQHTRPDLEEELSRLIGDVPAHQIGQAARSVFGFARRAADTFTQNVSEFLQEEGRDTPSRTEADEFASGVDKLRDDVDRLEARVALLERNKNK
ncbi:MAG TPA: SCP2 sterol-binding domain-containing protein [Steroidobacteraceae bacterium]|nr:SCP2 sterol-binding domain-containing protein [Steroidobacteraceae bacterium]